MKHEDELMIALNRPAEAGVDESVARVGDRLRQHVAEQTDRQASRKLPWRLRRQRGRRIGFAASVATALVATVFVATNLTGRQHVGVEPVSAAALLERAAHSVSLAPPPAELKRGDVLYVRLRTSRLLLGDGSRGGDRSQTWKALGKAIEEQWVSTNGDTRLRIAPYGKPEYLTPADRKRWQRNGSGYVGYSSVSDRRFKNPWRTLHFGNLTLKFDELQSLPTQPRRLLRVLERATRDPGLIGSRSWRIFTGAFWAMRAAPLPRDVQAAIYRAVALLPGVTGTARAVDQLGREGSAVSFVDKRSGWEQSVVFDPNTGAMFEQRETALRESRVMHIPAGTHTLLQTVEQSGVVGSIKDRP